MPPYPEPTLQIVLSCGKWQMKRRSGFTSSVQWRPRLKSFESPSMVSACVPMRVMMRMLSATYTLSVSSMPTLLMGEPIGPMTYGITYIVRPFIEPSKSLPSFS